MKRAKRLLTLEELQGRKVLLDHTWTLVVVLGSMLAVVSWYLGLAQLDMAPVVWALGSLALAQFTLNSRLQTYTSKHALQMAAFTSQLLGIVGMAVAWHLFGGLHQPMFPLFLLLPTWVSVLVLNRWQQQAALAALLLVLVSGIVLTPDTNSFIQERYGFALLSAVSLPDWFPRTRIAFADVSTSPSYDLMMMGTLALVALAVHVGARAVVNWFESSLDRMHSLQTDLHAARALTTSLVTHAPTPEVIVVSATGRIQQASERFQSVFLVDPAPNGHFLLDCVQFAYPNVIKRLIATGGEEIQGATVRGKEVVLRIRAGLIDFDGVQVARVSLENCDDICWRGAVDALEEPVFAVNSRGDVIFMNRSAIAIFGAEAENSSAGVLFDAGSNLARWWDIAPLESARRIMDRNGRKYLASIHRDRIADSIGDLAFVHLHEREDSNAAAAA